MSNTNTKEDFENAGYTSADASRHSVDQSKNWKAANGGKRLLFASYSMSQGIVEGSQDKKELQDSMIEKV